MATNALKKINAEAKRLHKKSPGRSYRACQKEAGREYRAGKISGRKKPRAKKKAAPRKKARKRVGAAPKRHRIKNVEHFGTIGTLAGHKTAAKKIIDAKLSKKLLERDLATNKPKKRKLSKEITKLKTERRAFAK